jgi:hypothetical protein
MRRSETLRSQIGGDLHLVGIYPEKLSPEMREAIVAAGIGRVHPAKYPDKVKRALRSDPNLSRIASRKMSSELKRLFGYREEYEGDWILVNSHFAAAYMAALAAMLAREAKLSPLTSQEAYQGLNLRFLIEGDKGPGEEQDANGALLTLVMESLRIDPKTSVSKMIAFRRSRATQLAELSAMFDDLGSKIEKSEDQRDLKDKARRAFENRIRPGLEKVKKELQDQTIQSTWKGFYQSAMFSAPLGTVIAAFAQANSASIVGAGLLLSGVNVAVNSIFARRKSRASSPYTYLLDIERKFSLPRYN